MLGKCRTSDTECSRAYCYCRCFGGIALAVALLLVVGLVAQILWNWLVPDLFNLGAVSYAQALGLVILGRLLFGGFGHHHGFGRWHRHSGWCGWPKGGDCGDWRHYGAWWDAEGKESFKKFGESKKAGKETPPPL
ncbi:MAG: hypothetical protein HZA04_05095 [Nitrospinae bacterium]|nr:hypothetical protein [Nitrospinota bacterium]